MSQAPIGSGKLKRTIRLVKFIENAVRNTGWFVLVKDGSKEPIDINWLDTPSFYTKLYRMKLDGEFVNTWVRFVYNTRDNWADFEMRYNNNVASVVTARELSERRIIRAMQVASECENDDGSIVVGNTVRQ
jgi:hypothetical protein